MPTSPLICIHKYLENYRVRELILLYESYSSLLCLWGRLVDIAYHFPQVYWFYDSLQFLQLFPNFSASPFNFSPLLCFHPNPLCYKQIRFLFFYLFCQVTNPPKHLLSIIISGVFGREPTSVWNASKFLRIFFFINLTLYNIVKTSSQNWCPLIKGILFSKWHYWNIKVLYGILIFF